MRTIQVTGKGQLRVKPDQTRITLSLEGLYPEYGEHCVVISVVKSMCRLFLP